jgi:hypothetical protein
MLFVRDRDIEIHYQATGQGTPFLFFSETACPGDIWNHFQVPEFSRDTRSLRTITAAPGNQAGRRHNIRARTLSTTRPRC